MGTSSAAKRPARGVTSSIQNSIFQISDFRAFFRLLVFLCAFCIFAGNSSAQTLEDLARQIRSGNAEEKRTALFEIRNARSKEYSRIAVPALQDSDEIVRATAAFSVIFLPKEEAFGALAPNLRDKSELVRRETVYALGKTQNPAAINSIILTFQKDKSTEVKNAGVVALGEIGDASAIDFLTQILQSKAADEDDFLRRSAARSIGQIAQIIQIRESDAVTPESFLPEKYKFFTLEKYRELSAGFPQFRSAVPVLTRILQTPKEAADTKREAAFALGAIGDRSALPVLRSGLTSKDYYLAEICEESIKKLSSVSSTE